jgi:hypothetical protein
MSGFLARRRERQRIERLREQTNTGVDRMLAELTGVARLQEQTASVLARDGRPLTQEETAEFDELVERRRALEERRSRLQIFCAPRDYDTPYGLDLELAGGEPDERRCLSTDRDANGRPIWVLKGTGSASTIHASRELALVQLQQDHERWHARSVWRERLTTDELAALTEIQDAVANALADVAALAADVAGICHPLLDVAEAERRWSADMEHLDRVQRSNIAADDLLM